MKLLITGGCGFLGSNLAAHALQRGDELTIFDNLSRLGATDNLAWLKGQGDFRFVHGDIRNNSDVLRLIKEVLPDAIFHLAGQVAMTTSIANPRLDFEVNAMGSINVLEAVRQCAPEAAMIYSSSNKVYGDLNQFTYRETETRYECIDHPNGFSEGIPLEFRSPYGCSKGAADQYMLDYARIYGLRTMVFRHSSMYGGRQFATYDQGWIGWFCQQAIQQKLDTNRAPFTISGNGKQVRDVLHADDMTTLYFAALEKIDAVKGQSFNIGGGVESSLSLIELFHILEEYVGTNLRYIACPPRVSDQLVFVADITKIKANVNWVPIMPVRQGLTDMLSWVQEQIR